MGWKSPRALPFYSANAQLVLYTGLRAPFLQRALTLSNLTYVCIALTCIYNFCFPGLEYKIFQVLNINKKIDNKNLYLILFVYRQVFLDG